MPMQETMASTCIIPFSGLMFHSLTYPKAVFIVLILTLTGGARGAGRMGGWGGRGWRSFCNPKEFYKGIQSLLQKQLIRYFKTFR